MNRYREAALKNKYSRALDIITDLKIEVKDLLHQLSLRSPEKDVLRDRLKVANKEIEELKAGKCRYNCNTAKENFLDGFQYGVRCLAKSIYNEFDDDFPPSKWTEEDDALAQEAWCESRSSQ